MTYFPGKKMGHGFSGGKFQNRPPVCSILLWVNQQSEVDRKYKVAIYFDFAKKEVWIMTGLCFFVQKYTLGVALQSAIISPQSQIFMLTALPFYLQPAAAAAFWTHISWRHFFLFQFSDDTNIFCVCEFWPQPTAMFLSLLLHRVLYIHTNFTAHKRRKCNELLPL